MTTLKYKIFTIYSGYPPVKDIIYSVQFAGWLIQRETSLSPHFQSLLLTSRQLVLFKLLLHVTQPAAINALKLSCQGVIYFFYKLLVWDQSIIYECIHFLVTFFVKRYVRTLMAHGIILTPSPFPILIFRNCYQVWYMSFQSSFLQGIGLK